MRWGFEFLHKSDFRTGSESGHTPTTNGMRLCMNDRGCEGYDHPHGMTVGRGGEDGQSSYGTLGMME